MRKVLEILRLKFDAQLTDRQIADSCGVSRSTVSDYVRRAIKAGLSWPLPADIDETTLYERLNPSTTTAGAREGAPLPDWAQMHRELKRKGVTRTLLWQEYKARYPDGLQYSQFCQHYRDWLKVQSPVMRQHHRAGEKCFVDYAGMTLDVVDRQTGECRSVQIFVATLGASNYTFCEATWTQSLSDWLGSHRRALEYFGSVPAILVPDNLKTGVTKACYYEPEINRSYLEFAQHYDVAVVPTRVARPRDKSKVEVHVQIVERQVLAPLRNQLFFSLHELNTAIGEALHRLNRQPMQKRDVSRLTLFEQLDRPAMKPLPKHPYQFADWKRAKVHLDYHIELDRHCYSVPHRLVGQRVDIRYNDATVEIFHRAKRVASHRRQTQRGGHTTVTEHMPKAHQRAGQLTPQRLIAQATKIGPYTRTWVERTLAHRPHPEQGFRTCLGALRLAKRYGEHRLEAACRRALSVNAFSYRSLDSMLKHGLDQQPLPFENSEDKALLDHPNVRGADYFH